jgi:hypothetical protein
VRERRNCKCATQVSAIAKVRYLAHGVHFSNRGADVDIVGIEEPSAILVKYEKINHLIGTSKLVEFIEKFFGISPLKRVGGNESTERSITSCNFCELRADCGCHDVWG